MSATSNCWASVQQCCHLPTAKYVSDVLYCCSADGAGALLAVLLPRCPVLRLYCCLALRCTTMLPCCLRTCVAGSYPRAVLISFGSVESTTDRVLAPSMVAFAAIMPPPSQSRLSANITQYQMSRQ